jgi:endonuclease/exonuclease/phosphatase (EEP) superfamily protein YafD
MIHTIYNLGLFSLIAFVLASYLGKRFWICDILSNFRLYYIFASIIFLLFALIFKNKIGALLLLGAIAIQAFTVYQSYSNHPRTTSKTDVSEEVNLLQYNVHYLNKNHVEIVNYLIENQAELDIIFLQEVTPELKVELDRVEKYFPYKVVINDKWFGRAFYSKLPISSHEIKFFDHEVIDRKAYPSKSKDLFFNSPIHYMIVHLKTKEQSIPLTLYGIHTTAPFSSEFAKRRNNELNSIAEEINQDVSSKHKILVGDFNVTSSSYWYRSLEKTTGLVSSERGTGINNTWPSWLKFNLLRISIDNALVSSNIIVETRIIGKNIGSDHLPVILKLNCIK